MTFNKKFHAIALLAGTGLSHEMGQIRVEKVVEKCKMLK